MTDRCEIQVSYTITLIPEELVKNLFKKIS